MRIIFGDGSSVYAWILSLAGGVMRVAVKDGGDDAMELRLENHIWISENGQTASFEFPWGMAGATAFVAGVAHMASDPSVQKACGGGGECVVRQLLQSGHLPEA